MAPPNLRHGKSKRGLKNASKPESKHLGHEKVDSRGKSDPCGDKLSRSRTYSLPLWKKILFSATATLAMLLLFEGTLAVVGVRPVLFEVDPYVGFTSQIPLFDSQTDENGAHIMVTAPNKIRWFNAQSFPSEKPSETFRVFCLGGSTTYGRPYDDATSFCGWLRELLPRADSSKKWELINAGGISYASYRVAKLSEELIQYEPDLFVVYSGHNEFLESRTYEGLIRTPSAIRELGALVSHTRMYAAMQRGYLGIAGQSTRADQKRATLNAEVTTILGESIGPKDYHRDEAFRQQVLDHYRYNMTRIVNIARSVGAEVVFVTPASNLLDCSPFKSEHRESLTAAELQRWEELYEKAQAAMNATRWEDAVTVLDEAATIDDRYAHLHYLRGKALHHLGRYEDSKEALIRGRDEDVCPLRALGSMRDIVNQTASACRVPVVDFAAVVESRSPHGIPGENLFLDHVHPTIEGNRLLAVEVLDVMTRSGYVKPEATWGVSAVEEVATVVESRLDRRSHAKALQNLSKVLAWAGKYEEAQRLIEVAAAMTPDDAGVHFQFGVCAQREGDLVEAAKHYEQAIRLAPDYVEAHNNLGSVLEELGELQEAMDHFRLAIALNCDDDKAHFNLGKVLLQQGDLEPALEHFRRVVELRPLDAEAYVVLASALVRVGQGDGAVEALERAGELKPRDPDILNKLGSLRAAQGDYADAQDCYRRALGLDANHVGAMESLAWLLATARDARFRDGKEAVKLAKRACEMAPNEDPATIDVLAGAQAEAGCFEQASATARQAEKLALEQGRTGLARTIGRRLELYENGQPFRD